jgi:hypothetical protein
MWYVNSLPIMAEKINAGSVSSSSSTTLLKSGNESILRSAPKYVKIGLVLGIISLVIFILDPSCVLSWIGLIIFIIAWALVLSGLFCVYYIIKYNKFKINKVGNEVIMPLVELLMGLIILAIVYTA